MQSYVFLVGLLVILQLQVKFSLSMRHKRCVTKSDDTSICDFGAKNLLQASCDFDQTNCGYQFSASSLKWQRHERYTGLIHMPASPNGTFMYSDTQNSNSEIGASSTMSTTMVPAGTVCFKFLYFLPNSAYSNIHILAQVDGIFNSDIWIMTNPRYHAKWLTRTFVVTSDREFKISFMTTKFSKYGSLGIDNVQIWVPRLDSEQHVSPKANPISSTTTSTTPTTTLITTPLAAPVTKEPLMPTANPISSTTTSTTPTTILVTTSLAVPVTKEPLMSTAKHITTTTGTTIPTTTPTPLTANTTNETTTTLTLSTSTPGTSAITVANGEPSPTNTTVPISPITYQSNVTCPSSVSSINGIFRLHGDYCLQFVNDQKDWTDARDDCGSRGGTLVRVKDQNTQDFIQHVIQQDLKWTSNGVWIGADDLKTEGRWRWVTGERVTWSNWQSGYGPERSGFSAFTGRALDCAQIRLDQSGKWQDAGCTFGPAFHYSYICQYVETPK